MMKLLEFAKAQSVINPEFVKSARYDLREAANLRGLINDSLVYGELFNPEEAKVTGISTGGRLLLEEWHTEHVRSRWSTRLIRGVWMLILTYLKLMVRLAWFLVSNMGKI